MREAKLEVVVEREEEHSAWMVGYKDPTNATRYINTEFLAMPEFRRTRALVKTVVEIQHAALRDCPRNTAADRLPTGATC